MSPQPAIPAPMPVPPPPTPLTAAQVVAAANYIRPKSAAATRPTPSLAATAPLPNSAFSEALEAVTKLNKTAEFDRPTDFPAKKVCIL